MSAFLYFFSMGMLQLPYLQSGSYYDLIIMPAYFTDAKPYQTAELPSGYQRNHFRTGIYLPDYRRCQDNQDAASCMDNMDYRPQLEMGPDKWKLGAKVNGSGEVRLRLKIPLQ